MRIIHILKKDGSKREIYAPSPDEKARLRRQLNRLNGFAIMTDRHFVAHGFMPGRSPVTNAMQHRGYAFSLSFDLEDFFNTVTPEHVMNIPGFFSDEVAYCFVDGSAKQGLPTSPALANIAASAMDNDIMALRARSRLGWNFGEYTRYADDMTFSFDREHTARWLLQVIPPIVERHRFRINPAKTRLQAARAGRRIITGVAVDSEIHAPRKVRRKLRAARHQMNRPQARGLREWTRLRLPHGYVPPQPPPILATYVREVVEVTISAPGRFVRAVFGRRII